MAAAIARGKGAKVLYEGKIGDRAFSSLYKNARTRKDGMSGNELKCAFKFACALRNIRGEPGRRYTKGTPGVRKGCA